MIYRFESFQLDTDLVELRRNGEPITVEPQVFALLLFLIENRERVVSKDELIESVWQGRIVSDATLNSRINSVRKAVHDDGTAQAVIKTVPRRGFRFVGKINEQIEHSSLPVPLGFADDPSIAVLPFDNLSGDPDQEHFADGIVDDILTELSKYHWLRVIARNTSFTFKGRPIDVKSAGAEIGARYILEGSVRKSGMSVVTEFGTAERLI